MIAQLAFLLLMIFASSVFGFTCPQLFDSSGAPVERFVAINSGEMSHIERSIMLDPDFYSWFGYSHVTESGRSLTFTPAGAEVLNDHVKKYNTTVHRESKIPVTWYDDSVETPLGILIPRWILRGQAPIKIPSNGKKFAPGVIQILHSTTTEHDLFDHATRYLSLPHAINLLSRKNMHFILSHLGEDEARLINDFLIDRLGETFEQFVFYQQMNSLSTYKQLWGKIAVTRSGLNDIIDDLKMFLTNVEVRVLRRIADQLPELTDAQVATMLKERESRLGRRVTSTDLSQYPDEPLTVDFDPYSDTRFLAWFPEFQQ